GRRRILGVVIELHPVRPAPALPPDPRAIVTSSWPEVVRCKATPTAGQCYRHRHLSSGGHLSAGDQPRLAREVANLEESRSLAARDEEHQKPPSLIRNRECVVRHRGEPAIDEEGSVLLSGERLVDIGPCCLRGLKVRIGLASWQRPSGQLPQEVYL